MSSLAGHVVLTDGTLVWIEGIGSWYRFAKHSPGAEAVIVEMNRLVGEYQGVRAVTQ